MFPVDYVIMHKQCQNMIEIVWSRCSNGRVFDTSLRAVGSNPTWNETFSASNNCNCFSGTYILQSKMNVALAQMNVGLTHLKCQLYKQSYRILRIELNGCIYFNLIILKEGFV